MIRRLIGAWTERVESAPLDVVEGSALAEDDEATAYLQLSQMVHMSLHVAVDHLQMMVSLISDAKHLPSYGSLTLERGALESGATAVCLHLRSSPRGRIGGTRQSARA